MDIAGCRDNRFQQVTSGTVRRELSIISHALNVAAKEWGGLGAMADYRISINCYQYRETYS